MMIIRRLSWTDAHLADIPLPTKTMSLTRSLASGLCRSAIDDPGVFWGIGDRGPNIKPGAIADQYGTEHLRSLGAFDGAKIMPLPQIGPAIARFRLVDNAIMLEEMVELTDSQGRTITGLPGPGAAHSEQEPVYDLSGKALRTNASGADTEGIAAMPDGTFWIADEYGPSLLRADRSGRILFRWVPSGQGDCYADAGYPIEDKLPSLAAARKLNRGFEAVTAAPDGSSVVIAFQSPLAHPDRQAHEHSRHVRIWELDATTGDQTGEFIYPLDGPQTFCRDAAAGKVASDDVKISEVQLIEGRAMLVLERISLTTKIYRVELERGLSIKGALADPKMSPTIEQMSSGALGAAGIPVLTKELAFSSDDHPEICGDLEGMILFDGDTLLLANDSDFGIDGVQTEFWSVHLPHPVLASRDNNYTALPSEGT